MAEPSKSPPVDPDLIVQGVLYTALGLIFLTRSLQLAYPEFWVHTLGASFFLLMGTGTALRVPWILTVWLGYHGVRAFWNLLVVIAKLMGRAKIKLPYRHLILRVLVSLHLLTYWIGGRMEKKRAQGPTVPRANMICLVTALVPLAIGLLRTILK
jgi:hypothetical protein